MSSVLAYCVQMILFACSLSQRPRYIVIYNWVPYGLKDQFLSNRFYMFLFWAFLLRSVEALFAVMRTSKTYDTKRLFDYFVIGCKSTTWLCLQLLIGQLLHILTVDQATNSPTYSMLNYFCYYLHDWTAGIAALKIWRVMLKLTKR